MPRDERRVAGERLVLRLCRQSTVDRRGEIGLDHVGAQRGDAVGQRAGVFRLTQLEHVA
jgi:hypothetical protein